MYYNCICDHGTEGHLGTLAGMIRENAGLPKPGLCGSDIHVPSKAHFAVISL